MELTEGVTGNWKNSSPWYSLYVKALGVYQIVGILPNGSVEYYERWRAWFEWHIQQKNLIKDQMMQEEEKMERLHAKVQKNIGKSIIFVGSHNQPSPLQQKDVYLFFLRQRWVSNILTCLNSTAIAARIKNIDVGTLYFGMKRKITERGSVFATVDDIFLSVDETQ